MRPATLLRLALAGTRTDTLRMVLTAFSAALAGLAALCAATVLAIDPPGPFGAARPGSAQQYGSALLRSPGLRPGVALTLLLMAVPVLAFAAQCARIGSRERDSRLAALRAAGATPRQVTAVAAAETGLAALAGTVTALVVYLVLRVLLHDPGKFGRLPLPTDVLPSPLALAAVVLGLPAAAVVAAAVLLRRSTVLRGVRGRSGRGAPRAWPAVLLGIGTAAVVAGQFVPFSSVAGAPAAGGRVLLSVGLLLGGGSCLLLGTVLSAAWIAHAAGGVLHRCARRPATLIAARRLQDDPWSGGRAFGTLLTCVLCAAVVAAVRSLFEALVAARAERQRIADARAGQDSSPAASADADFYLGTMDLLQAAVLVALALATLGLMVGIAESVVSRRRTHAALKATGVPSATLAKTVAWQALTPVVPATLLALAVGTLLGRAYGHEYTATGYGRTPTVVVPAGVPWADLALYGSVTLAFALAAVGAGLLLLRGGASVEELRTG